MKKYLITPSLLNSFQYYIDNESENEFKIREDFLTVLKREQIEKTESMQKGIDFEEKIMALCKNLISEEEERHLEECYLEIANIVRGGFWQCSVKKEIDLFENKFLVYGKCDVIKADTIYDIKFSSKYDIGKYLNSAQHLVYLYCTGIPKFSYLISDGYSFFREDYYNDSVVENLLISKILDFTNYLNNDKEAKNLFISKWGSL